MASEEGRHRVELAFRLITAYNHLRAPGVFKGWTVQAGDPIGKTGTTGPSAKGHLRFETILGAASMPTRGNRFATLLLPRSASSLALMLYA